jgi:hypothetical protein
MGHLLGVILVHQVEEQPAAPVKRAVVGYLTLFPGDKLAVPGAGDGNLCQRSAMVILLSVKVEILPARPA